MLHSSISSTIVECGSRVWNQDQLLIFGSSFGIYSSHHHHRRHHLNLLSWNSSTSGAPPLSWGMWVCWHRWRNHKGDPTNGKLMRCIDKTHDENHGLFCSLSRFSPQITLFQSDKHDNSPNNNKHGQQQPGSWTKDPSLIFVYSSLNHHCHDQQPELKSQPLPSLEGCRCGSFLLNEWT